MNYKQFQTILKDNKLTMKEVKSILGYGENSIGNNWKKNDYIPDKALITLRLYLELEEKKEALRNIKIEQGNNQITLSKKAYAIAMKKSEKNDIDTGEYISSLVISAI